MKKEDKELLQAAAESIGLPVVWVTQTDTGLDIDYIVDLPEHAHHFVIERHPYPRWNPLEDDGDALRLAIAARLDIYGYQFYEDTPHIEAIHEEGARYAEASEDLAEHNGDALAAVRRAIVHAAARLSQSKRARRTARRAGSSIGAGAEGGTTSNTARSMCMRYERDA